MNYQIENIVAFSSTCFTRSAPVVASSALTIVSLPVLIRNATICSGVPRSHSSFIRFGFSARLRLCTCMFNNDVYIIHSLGSRSSRCWPITIPAKALDDRNLNALTFYTIDRFRLDSPALLIFREHSTTFRLSSSCVFKTKVRERLSTLKYFFIFLCLRKFNELIHTHFFSPFLLSATSNEFHSKPSKISFSHFYDFLSLLTQVFSSRFRTGWTGGLDRKEKLST